MTARGGLTVRTGIELKSQSIGNLEAGREIQVDSSTTNSTGTMRLHVLWGGGVRGQFGWVSDLGPSKLQPLYDGPPPSRRVQRERAAIEEVRSRRGLEIVVPAGCPSSALLAFEHASCPGQQMRVGVPADAGPGTSFQVLFRV